MNPTITTAVVPVQQMVYYFLISTSMLLGGCLWLIRGEALRIAKEEVATHARTPHGDVDAVKRLGDQMASLEKSVHELAISLARWEGSCNRRHAEDN